jgi:NADPH-dependent glutamate synthase beta subunit-like oxidoreductase/NAD(P)H-flavin reductase
MEAMDLEELYDIEKLEKLDQKFLGYLSLYNNSLYLQLMSLRQDQVWNSNFAIELAFELERFVAAFFSIENELQLAKEKYPLLNRVYECKRLFIQRYVLKASYDIPNHSNLDQLSLLISSNLSQYNIDNFEQIFAEHALMWLSLGDKEKLDIAKTYALWACLHPDGIIKHKNGTLFKFSNKLDFDNLLPLVTINKDGITSYKHTQIHKRDGFKLTDHGCNIDFAVDQANYCIHCHKQNKDSCSKGLNIDKNGCPLDEKISEMNYLKSKGNIIGSLAIAILDNPMLAATGHRICNECMKSCIYQKQEPVNIPQIESRVLKDVLQLPWGFEIYSLLTRWNPLSLDSYLPKQDTGAKILVAGMGPAGFTLAHYLLNEGHIVVGMDGLKIEPLPENILTKPIKDIYQLFEDLDKRLIYGFGGVMEYGITNRWDKNFLLIIRLLLQRRENFKLFGGIRLGSNITPYQAFDFGFQHIALALGAGGPKILPLKDTLAKGIRTASDFLMSLQLGAAYRLDSLTNLQIRMPVVIIGGGLTALDAATEAAAYYPELVKKIRLHYKENNSDALTEEERSILQELLENKEPISVKILYRSSLQQAPSYRLNHEELNLGLKENIEFVENITPNKILLDEYGYVSGLEATQIVNGTANKVQIQAKTIIIAAGTTPNVILADEYPELLTIEGKYFKAIDGDPFIAYKDDNFSISFLGDLHPQYAGNVVKAMASAKDSYKRISQLVKSQNISSKDDFMNMLNGQLLSKVMSVSNLTNNIVELQVSSPLAAVNFKPGQFFRLQNYRNHSSSLMEGLALTGSKVKNDIISMIVLQMGESSRLCKKLLPGEEVVLMGPSGTATNIPKNETVLLIGGGLGNAVLFSIGQALRDNNNHVLYLAGYRKLQDVYKIEEIEAASDQIIWACQEQLIPITRNQDYSFKGNIISALSQFSLIHPEKKIDRIIAIGSDGMMKAVQQARFSSLQELLNCKTAIASINSPMQCMMKEICGQCLQKHIDPDTKIETYVFSCTDQDQNIDQVDFSHLRSRLEQNSLLEKIFLFANSN